MTTSKRVVTDINTFALGIVVGRFTVTAAAPKAAVDKASVVQIAPATAKAGTLSGREHGRRFRACLFQRAFQGGAVD